MTGAAACAHLTMPSQIVIAYWLVPSEPARSYFQRLINDFAQRYDGPEFEPHVTVHVGANCGDAVEGVLSKVTRGCERIVLQALEINHSSEFTKTLFVQFAGTAQLVQLHQNIRTAAHDSLVYQLNPHMSLLYKAMSSEHRGQLACSIDVPFPEVTFDLLRAVRCISSTQSRADVEAWRVVAAMSLGSLGV
jgi:2'-5' RNA ligase